MEKEQFTLQFKNSSYFVLPFCYQANGSFRDLVNVLRANREWKAVHDKNIYMLKYVADKFDSQNPKDCQCFHFVRAPQTEEGTLYATDLHPFKEEDIHFTFLLKQVHLYCFSTQVGILAFEVNFTENDPLWIATAEYYLKKVSREFVVPITECNEPDLSQKATLLDLAKKLTKDVAGETPFDFFFFANDGTERANSLTYLDMPEQDNYSKELFYLRRCNSADFVYNNNSEVEPWEILHAAREISWGISPEAVVCLARPEGNESFVHDIFFHNFNHQYLFMYVLLLHQKYVLYMMLTQIGIGNYNNLETLEEYQRQLYEFETDFVFSRVTEVPQYQNLYNCLTEAFALKEMFSDVREPLASLSEIRKTDNEKKQQEQDKTVNRSLCMLSLLTFFSALLDGFDFADSFFSWFFSETVVKWIQGGTLALVFIVFLYVIKTLLSSRKK